MEQVKKLIQESKLSEELAKKTEQKHAKACQQLKDIEGQLNKIKDKKHRLEFETAVLKTVTEAHKFAAEKHLKTAKEIWERDGLNKESDFHPFVQKIKV